MVPGIPPLLRLLQDVPVNHLADRVLPLIRTRTDLHRWSVANAHGRQMHDAVDILESVSGHDPVGVFAVTQRAIASATKVVMRADDSSGIIGDACRRLLDLHALLASPAAPPAAKLVNWMIAWQHLCTVAAKRVDPVDVLGIIPPGPVPGWGWGDIPDQYGRRWEGDDGESSPPPNPRGTDLPPILPEWQPRPSRRRTGDR